MVKTRRSGPPSKIRAKWMLWKENTREVDSLGLARGFFREMKKLSQS